MGRLSNISGYKAAKAFEKAGWEKMGQVGSQVGWATYFCCPPFLKYFIEKTFKVERFSTKLPKP
jgi:hypothetical protein